MAWIAVAGAAHADEAVFYRCTDSAGALTVQNTPCPKGAREERRVVQGVASAPSSPAATSATVPASARDAAVASGVANPAPAPVNAVAAPVSPPAAVAPPAEAGVRAVIGEPADTAAPAPPAAPATARLPPPNLFQCTTYDQGTYISEDAEAASRCVPLRTVGLDGDPQRGAGQACEVVRDTCARVPDGALCEAWKKRLGEVEVAWRFGRADNTGKNRAEFERVTRILNESACAGSAP